ncbi:MAG TPA: hypothetical protein VF524_12065, partial [Polyangia bacterium]
MKIGIRTVAVRGFLPIVLSVLGSGLLGCATGQSRGVAQGSASACDCPCARKSDSAKVAMPGSKPAARS